MREFTERYIFREHDTIRRLCRPVRDRLDVAYVTYHRITNDGHWSALVDRPDWAEQYVENAYYQIDPHLRHPDQYDPGVYLLNDVGSTDFQEMAQKESEKFGIYKTLTLIEKSKDCVEMMGFSVAKNRPGLLNQVPYLKLFMNYFKQEGAELLDRVQADPVDLVELKGAAFQPAKDWQSTIVKPSLWSFLREIKWPHIDRVQTPLSKRERQCLVLLFDGFSGPQIAEKLELSHRTIEHYLENVKNKWTCESRQELISIARDLQRLGLL